MDNLIQILNLLNKQTNAQETSNQTTPIPKEILDQYPYGEFPSRYTKSGQEDLRIKSQNRYSSIPSLSQEQKSESNNDNLNINTLLPLIQMMSNKKQPSDMMKIFSEILFKDNKDMQQLFQLFSKNKSQEIKPASPFPNTNKVNISSLRRIND